MADRFSNTPAEVRQTTPAMRVMLLVAAVLVTISGFQLFVLSTQTDTDFAWTIAPSLTAAFLGASYWAAGLLEFLAFRERNWTNARIAVPGVLTFTTLTLAATLLHLDRFHLRSSNPVTLAATIAWIVVYAAVPILMGGLLVLQLRVRGGDAPRVASISGPLQVAATVLGAFFCVLGVALFLAPQAVLAIWPWTLTLLTARAVGAWLIGFGVVALQAAREDDRRRIGSASLALTLLGVLQLVALARFPSDMQWGRASAWLYLFIVLSCLVIGIAGLTQSKGARASTLEAL